MTPTATAKQPPAARPIALPDLDPTAAAANAVLRQCAAVVRNLNDADYTTPSRTIAGSTIGQHVRHCLDHFAAALRSLDGEPIDYDHRERNTPIESSRHAALEAIDALRASLARVDAPVATSRVDVIVMLSAGGDLARLASTLARELAFATHHAVHHHAMIAAIARERSVDVPPDFGKAPSTLRFEHDARS